MIEITRDGATVTIRLNRPPANAFTAEGLAVLEQTVDDLNRDAKVRAIVVTARVRSSSARARTSISSPTATAPTRGSRHSASAQRSRRCRTHAR